MTARTARMLAVVALLLGWQQLAATATCTVAAASLAALTLIVGAAGLEAAVQRRHAFAAQYLAAEGRLFRLLRPGAVTLAWQTVKALLLACVLLLNALVLEAWQWTLLVVDAVLMAVLVGALARRLTGEVREAYVAPIARRWAEPINAALVWIALVLGLFYAPQANLGALRWEEVVSLAAGQVGVGCQAIALLARVAAVSGSLALWAAQNLFADLGDAQETVAAWLMFIAAFGASFLFAWAYSRALTGTVASPWRAWRGTGASPE